MKKIKKDRAIGTHFFIFIFSQETKRFYFKKI
jgi:hypothetical protein